MTLSGSGTTAHPHGVRVSFDARMRECTSCCGCAHCVFYASANPSISETQLGYHNRRRGLFRLSLKTLCYQCCKIEVLCFPCYFLATSEKQRDRHLATLYKRHFCLPILASKQRTPFEIKCLIITVFQNY